MTSQSDTAEAIPFKSTVEMLPLLRSRTAEATAVFEARLAVTDRETARRLLLDTQNSFLFLLPAFCVQISNRLFHSIAEFFWGSRIPKFVHVVEFTFVSLSVFLYVWFLWWYRGTAQTCSYYLATLPPNSKAEESILRLFRAIYRKPSTEWEREFNERVYGQMIRHFDESSAQTVKNLPTIHPRNFLKRRYFDDLWKGEREISDAELYALVAILRFLKESPKEADRALLKRIRSTPLPGGNIATLPALKVLQDVSRSLLRQDGAPLATHIVGANPSPATTTLNIQQGRKS